MATKHRETAKVPLGKHLRGQPIVDGVLRAAADELMRAELRAPSIEDIAKASGVNKTTIYRRWVTLDALLLEASTMVFANLEVAPDTGGLESDLVAFFEGVTALLSALRMQHPAQLGLNDAISANLTQQFAHLQKTKTSEFKAIFRRAVARGELANASSEKVVGELVGARLVLNAIEKKPAATRSYLRSLVSTVLRGIDGFEA